MSTQISTDERYVYALDMGIAMHIWNTVGKDTKEYHAVHNMACILNWLDLAHLE